MIYFTNSEDNKIFNESELPEYLRDYTPQPEPTDYFEDIDGEVIDITGPGWYNSDTAIQETLIEEKNGTNSWLDNQPSGPGVSNPHQDAIIREISRHGYANTYRSKRPSLIYKQLKTNLSSILDMEERVRMVRKLLIEMKLDPSLFIREEYRFKSPKEDID